MASMRARAFAKRRFDGRGSRSRISKNGSENVRPKSSIAVVNAAPISSASDSTSESKSVLPTIASVRRDISCARSRVSPSRQRALIRSACAVMTSA